MASRQHKGVKGSFIYCYNLLLTSKKLSLGHTLLMKTAMTKEWLSIIKRQKCIKPFSSPASWLLCENLHTDTKSLLCLCIYWRWRHQVYCLNFSDVNPVHFSHVYDSDQIWRAYKFHYYNSLVDNFSTDAIGSSCATFGQRWSAIITYPCIAYKWVSLNLVVKFRLKP